METLEFMLSNLTEKGAYYINPENTEIFTREHLGECLASNYEASIAALDDGSLLKTLKIVDDDSYNFLNDLLKRKIDSSLVIFYLQYLLNNKLPFIYKEFVFKDIKTIGELLFDSKISEKLCKELLDNKLLSYYISIIGIDTIGDHLYKSVVLAENAEEFSYPVRSRLIAYALCQKDNYQYKSHKFYSVEEFYKYLNVKHKLDKFSKTFEQDYNFMAWLLYNGKYDICRDWIRKVDEYSKHEGEYIKNGKLVKKGK